MWDSNDYFRKAAKYIEMASAPERESWERPFWYSLSLEFLSRAALTNIHPALNAEPKDDAISMLYAFGIEIKGQPKSLPIHAVFIRLEKIVEDFKKPQREFCDFFSNTRNQELHTADLAFESLPERDWVGKYYEVADILCAALEKSLEDLLGVSEARTASTLIETLHSDKESAVKSRMAAHKKVFDAKLEDEKDELKQKQELIAITKSNSAHQIECPSCVSSGLLTGDIEKTSKPYFEDEQFLQKRTFLSDSFECAACGLKLNDIAEVMVAGLDPHFEKVTAADLHEYHEPDFGPEYDNM